MVRTVNGVSAMPSKWSKAEWMCRFGGRRSNIDQLGGVSAIMPGFTCMFPLASGGHRNRVKRPDFGQCVLSRAQTSERHGIVNWFPGPAVERARHCLSHSAMHRLGNRSTN